MLDTLPPLLLTLDATMSCIMLFSISICVAASYVTCVGKCMSWTASNSIITVVLLCRYYCIVGFVYCSRV